MIAPVLFAGADAASPERSAALVAVAIAHSEHGKAAVGDDDRYPYELAQRRRIRFALDRDVNVGPTDPTDLAARRSPPLGQPA